MQFACAALGRLGLASEETLKAHEDLFYRGNAAAFPVLMRGWAPRESRRGGNARPDGAREDAPAARLSSLQERRMRPPMDIAVRVATASDAGTLGRLMHAFNVEFETETPGADVIAEHAVPQIESGEILVLFAGEGPDGFAQLRFRSSLYSDAPAACLEELYVVPERRGHGLGRALLNAAIEHSRARGADHIDLNTSEADTAALGLYRSFGFTNREGSPDGPVMLYFERGI